MFYRGRHAKSLIDWHKVEQYALMGLVEFASLLLICVIWLNN